VPHESHTAASLTLLLLLAYPVAVHWGVLQGQPLPALLLLFALLLLPPLLARRYRAALLGLGLCLALGLLWWLSPLQTAQLFYLPPLAMLLVLWWLFARSLLPGERPLVTRIAALMHPQLSPRLLQYTRAVTWVWVGVLSLLLLEVLWLSCCASPALWSLFANVLNYLILGAVLLIEFALRGLFLPAEDRIGAVQFFRGLSRIRLHRL